MSGDVHEKFILKEEGPLFRYCEGNVNVSGATTTIMIRDDDDFNFKMKLIFLVLKLTFKQQRYQPKTG